MIIRKIHIENFGKLSNLNMDFESGVNSILRGNGWGKTTLVSFIRVMFYGFDGESKKKALRERERSFFRPWNGGVYGGSIEFSAGGKDYVLTRTFAATAKGDTFDLRDALTGIRSEDYDADNLGTGLFGVDSESYKKTSYIDHTAVKYSGVGSDVGSRVSRTPQADDIANFDKAQELIKDYLNSYSPTRATGNLHKLKGEISDLEIAIKDKARVEEGISFEKQRLSELLKTEENLKKSRKKLEEEKRAIASGKEKAINAGLYADKVKARDEREESLKKALSDLGERVPKEADIAALEEKLSQRQALLVKESALSEKRYDERFERLSRKYGESNISSEDILVQTGVMKEIRELNAKVSSLEENIREKKQSRSEIIEKNSAAQYLADARAEKSQKTGKALVIAGIALMAAAAAAFGITYHFFGFERVLFIALEAAVFVLGLILMITGLINKGKAAGIKNAVSFEDTDSFETEIESLSERIAGYEDEIRQKESGVRDFLSGFGVDYSRADAEEILYRMKAELSEYREKLESEKASLGQKDALTSEREALEEQIKDLCEKVGLGADAFTEGENIKEALRTLQEKIALYGHEAREFETAKKLCEDYLSEHPEAIESFSFDVAASEERLREIDSEESSIIEKLDDISSEKNSSKRKIADLYEREEVIAADEERLIGLKEDFEAESKRYKIVSATSEYLTKAKDMLIAGYMEPLRCSFEKYYDILKKGGENGEGSAFIIDSALGIQKKEMGAYRPVEALSDGLSDMTGLCMRAALLDVMYEGEKPVIIMDDPFSNLDEENLKWGYGFLASLAKNYQIIYMTCHADRTEN